MKQSHTLLTMVLAMMTAALVTGCDGFDGDSSSATQTVSLSSATATDTFSAVTITLSAAQVATIGSTEVAALEVSPILDSMDYILVVTAPSSKLSRAADDTTVEVICDSNNDGAVSQGADADSVEDTGCDAIPANTEIFTASSVPAALVTIIEAEELVIVATCETTGGCDLDGDGTAEVAEDATATVTVAAAVPVAPTCGDGWTCGVAGECTTGPSSGVEACDDGTASNSDTTADACRTDCSLASCGDGVTDTGEACDDGTSNILETAWDGTTTGLCSTTCAAIGCGNGTTETANGETCDDGGTTNADAILVSSTCAAGSDCCDGNCTLPACGNDVLGIDGAGLAEACDDGNSLDTDLCVSGCVVATCGDGYTCSGTGCTTGPSGGVEACDNGSSTNSDTVVDACRTNCAAAGCGDDVIDTGEVCDNGSSNSDTTADACRSTCVAASCGDGVIDTGEACDNGSSNSNTTADACRSTCVAASCGDGVVDTGESCEVGVNSATSDTCVSCALLTSWCTVFETTATATGVTALQLSMVYSTDVAISGTGSSAITGGADCTTVASGATIEISNDLESTNTLNWAYTSLSGGFTAPSSLFQCTTVAGSAPATSDFTITVADSSMSSGSIVASSIAATSTSGACSN